MKASCIAWIQRYPRSILVVLTLVCLLPFADKAFHIDDPLFLWASRQMQIRWWDPYGFQVNWYGYPMPFHQVTKNPPLASALIAILSTLFGENEFSLHVGFFLQAVALILGTYTLSQRLCADPLRSALATLFAPVFMVSSTNMMCDVLMVALWVWAIVFWIRGLDNQKPFLLLFAALLIGACSLAKYFGMALIPLLVAYSLSRKGKAGWWLGWFLVPIVMVGLYEAVMRGLYGHGLVLDAFNYANRSPAHRFNAIPFKMLTAIGFVGGCCAIVLVFTPMLWRARSRVRSSFVLLFLFFITWIASGSFAMRLEGSTRLGVTVLWTLLVFGGLVTLVLPILDWRNRRDAETLLLLLWVWGTFAFCILNWTINGRSVLPMLPAIAILLLRQVEFTKRATSAQINFALVSVAMLSLLISLADYRLANSGRTAAEEIQTKFASGSATTIWFQGHWGFQYYAQEKGFRPFDLKHLRQNPGDLMVLPSNNTNLRELPENMVERVATIEVPVTSWVATTSRAVGAGFYADVWGPLPFSFGAVPSEKYHVVRFK
jgi:4-amino-4-deoxy-L-arabinose transferase-like glycosyltransferase